VLFAALAVVAALEWTARKFGFDEGAALRYEPPRVPGVSYVGRRLRGPASLIETPVVHYNAIGDRAPEPAQFGCARPFLVLGDSMSEGLWVADGQVWPALLQRRFAAAGACFYNGAHSGDGARRELRRYEALARMIRFDGVIIAAYANDVRLPIESPPALVSRLVPALLRVPSWLALRSSWNNRQPGMVVRAGALQGRDAAALDHAFAEYFAALDQLLARVRADGHSAGLLVIPNWSWMIAGDREFERRLEAWARSRTVPFAVVGYEDFRSTPFFVNNPHPNAEGHAGYARAAGPLVEAMLGMGGNN